MGATIQDVARMAGVTTGTVSRAFNNYQDIRPETRRRIRDAAEVLGYRPNISARNLAGKKVPNMGLIISGILEGDEKDIHAFQLLRGILGYTRAKNLEMAMYATDSAMQSTESYTDFCMRHSISGTILCGIRTDDTYFQELMRSGIPTVAIDFPVETGKGGWVSIDNRAAAAEAVQALLTSGHRKIVVMSGIDSADVTLVRMQGVMDACRDAGYELPADRILQGQFSQEEAYSRMKAYLASCPEVPDAVFCLSDLMALGVMRALKETGLRIPEDASVIGFDGIYIGDMCQPPLATVQQDMCAMGREAARMLHSLMRETGAGGHYMIPHQLKLKGSFQARK
ncbi:MAG: LacI family DNA-binding transcriptional regulator [Clostridia bacterium]|nr:LacI family DNA-binding transcriptional regulator [Clostridia bacterium]